KKKKMHVYLFINTYTYHLHAAHCKRPNNGIAVSAIKGDGLYEALEWTQEAYFDPKRAAKIKERDALEQQKKAEAKAAAEEAKEEKEKEKEKEPKKSKLEEWVERKDEDDDVFLEKFENVTLDGPFDHYVHLRLAYLYFTKFGRRQGLQKIFSNLQNFLTKSKNTRNTFSITITYFWAHMVWYALEATKIGKDNFKTFLVMNPRLSDFGLYKEYYSDDLFLKNAKSREEFMFPDKKDKQLPSTVDTNLQELKEAKKGIDVIAQLKQLAKEDTDDKTFIKLFETKQLQGWNHLYLLRAIWYYLETIGRKEGKNKIFSEIKRHDGDAYHETLTYFWLQMVDFFRMVAVELNTNKTTISTFTQWIELLRENSFRISPKKSWFSKSTSYDLED
ncbi:ARF-like GTPase ARLP2, atypical, partial [Reticulomyxa filosa]